MLARKTVTAESQDMASPIITEKIYNHTYKQNRV